MRKKTMTQITTIINSNELSSSQKARFNQMYPNGIDSLKIRQLETALSQCNNTITSNQRNKAELQTKLNNLPLETRQAVQTQFPNLLQDVVDSEVISAYEEFLLNLQKQEQSRQAELVKQAAKQQRDQLPKIPKSSQKTNLESFDSMEEAREFYEDEAGDLFECGQGFYQEEATAYAYIEDSLYQVTLTAEISSAKQDRGDRLYWVEKIKSISFNPYDTQLLEQQEKAAKDAEIKALEQRLATLKAQA